MNGFRERWRASDRVEKTLVVLFLMFAIPAVVIKIGIIIAVLNGAEVPHG